MEEQDCHVFTGELSWFWHHLVYICWCLLATSWQLWAGWRCRLVEKNSQIFIIETSQDENRCQKIHTIKSETLFVLILCVSPSLKGRLGHSNRTGLSYVDEKKAIWDSLTSKNMLLPTQPPPSILFPLIWNASSESTFPLRGRVTSSLQWCLTPEGRARRVTKVRKLSCQHRFHIMSGEGWDALGLLDTLCEVAADLLHDYHHCGLYIL